MLDKAVLMVREDNAANKKENRAILAAAAEKLRRKKSGTTSMDMAQRQGAGFHAVKVQYNPNTLEFQSSALPIRYANPQTADVQDTVIQNMETGTVTLNFDLEVNVDEDTDVRKTIQGLLGMLSQSSTRQAIFYWGTMSFAGDVIQVGAVYKQFDYQGKALKGTVHMTLSKQANTGVVK